MNIVFPPNRKIPEDSTVVDLLSSAENEMAAYALPNINSITFYKLDTDHTETDPFAAIEAFLGQRVFEVLQTNPWIAGRVQHVGKDIKLVYPNKVASVDGFFSVERTSAMTIDTPLDMMSEKTEPYLLQSAYATIDQDANLFRVTLVMLDDGYAAVVVSMSHIVADGSTFYSVYGMLSSSSKPFALSPVRKHDFIDDVVGAVGFAKFEYLRSTSFILSAIKSSFSKPKDGPAMIMIDQDYIAKVKSEYKATVEEDGHFLSSNDIVCSAVFNALETNYGMVAINFRDRISKLKKTDAGNYEHLLQFYPDEYAHPSGIRHALLDPPTFHSRRVTQAPGLIEGIIGEPAVVTNWANFYEDVTLPGATQTCHAPIPQVTLALPALCVVFRPRVGELALQMFCARDGLLQRTVKRDIWNELSAGEVLFRDH